MRRRPTLLLITILGLTWLGSALAEGESDPGFSVLAGSSITCSTAWPSATVGCWWERPVLVLGDVELALGVDGQAVLTGSWDDAHLAPYMIVAWYGATASAWLEVRLPNLGGIPVLGDSDYLRLGFSTRF